MVLPVRAMSRAAQAETGRLLRILLLRLDAVPALSNTVQTLQLLRLIAPLGQLPSCATHSRTHRIRYSSAKPFTSRMSPPAEFLARRLRPD